MGIKGLRKVLKKHGYEPEKESPKKFLKKIRGSTVAIDTSIYLYRYVNIFKECFISGFLRQIKLFLENDIVPVYVFDGAPTMEKEDILEKRKEALDKKKSKIKELEMEVANETVEETCNAKLKELQKHKANHILINQKMIDNLQKVFDMLGVYYYHYDGEADLFCRYLFEKDLVDYVITEDMDLLTHGCKKVITGFNTSSKKMEIYDNDDILKALEMTRPEFVDLCILLGCDYTGTPLGIGPVGAYNGIKKHGSIEEMIRKNTSDKVSFNGFKYKTARSMFTREVEVKKKLSKKKFIYKYKKDNIEKLREELQSLLITETLFEEVLSELISYKKRKKRELI